MIETIEISSREGLEWRSLLLLSSFPGLILISVFLFLGCFKVRRIVSEDYETNLLVTDIEEGTVKPPTFTQKSLKKVKNAKTYIKTKMSTKKRPRTLTEDYKTDLLIEEIEEVDEIPEEMKSKKGFVVKMKNAKTFITAKMTPKPKKPGKRASSEDEMLVRENEVSDLEPEKPKNVVENTPRTPFSPFGKILKSFKRNPKKSIEIYVPGVDAPPPKNPNRAPSAMPPPGAMKAYGWAAFSNRVSSIFFPRAMTQTTSQNMMKSNAEGLSTSLDKYPQSSLQEVDKEKDDSSELVIIRDSLPLPKSTDTL